MRADMMLNAAISKEGLDVKEGAPGSTRSRNSIDTRRTSEVRERAKEKMFATQPS